jgi:hypothetical protein
MLGEIGRLDDVVFIETTQVTSPLAGTADIADPWPQLPGGAVTSPNPFNPDWRGTALGATGDGAPGTPPNNPFLDVDNTSATTIDDLPTGETALPGWGEPWGPSNGIYEAMMLGDNAFGHAISLPVELRDGGVLDFGREHALAWYSIWGWGVVTDSSVVKIITN